jgi:Flp pilus assembly pilin Flp
MRVLGANVADRVRHMASMPHDSVDAIVRGEDGQGLAEYALIVFFIGVVAVAALTFLGSDISSMLSKLADQL